MYKSKHLPLLALALLVSSTELRAEESQLPFKVGDVVALYDAPSSSTNDALVFIVKQIKGRWISSSEGEDITGKKGEIYRSDKWINTDHYMVIDINPPEYLSRFGFTQPIPNPNAKPTFTYSVINGEMIVTTNSQTTNASIEGAPPTKNPIIRRRVWPKNTNAPHSPEKSTEKDASKVEGESK
jgi:hypothetical protein